MIITDEQAREITSLREQNGRLSPDIIWDEARSNRRSTLRTHFEFNKDAAAGAYNLNRARLVLARFQMRDVYINNERVRSRVYFRDVTRPAGETASVHVDEVMVPEDQWASLLYYATHLAGQAPNILVWAERIGEQEIINLASDVRRSLARIIELAEEHASADEAA